MRKILIIASGLAAALVATPASADWVRVCGPYRQVGVNSTGGPHFDRTCWDQWVGPTYGGGFAHGHGGYRGGWGNGYGMDSTDRQDYDWQRRHRYPYGGWRW